MRSLAVMAADAIAEADAEEAAASDRIGEPALSKELEETQAELAQLSARRTTLGRELAAVEAEAAQAAALIATAAPERAASLAKALANSRGTAAVIALRAELVEVEATAAALAELAAALGGGGGGV